MTPLVSLKGLTRDFASGSGFLKRRRVMRAVDDVSLDISRGSVTGVVGESGCGKSTLARLVLRLITATSGTVTYDGKDIGSLPSSAMRDMRRNMQMVFQDPYSAIDPRYTVRRAVMEPWQVQRIALPDPEARLAELMAKVGLNPSLANSYPHQLSGGQKQRVGIARALALNPAFLVLDEPTEGIQPSIIKDIGRAIEYLRDQTQMAIVLVEQYFDFARDLADDFLVLDRGEVVLSGVRADM
ncbi:MAG: ATP-binding cassette domain-containing protein, partial [Roseinatronobacter sp.]